MLKIYHNPRCRKSREGLEILEKSGKKFEVITYLETPPKAQELKALLKKLQLSPIELVRKGEQIWKEAYKDKTMTDDEVINAMIKHPKLIERPIVFSEEKAVIGRPPEEIKSLL